MLVMIASGIRGLNNECRRFGFAICKDCKVLFATHHHKEALQLGLCQVGPDDTTCFECVKDL